MKLLRITSEPLGLFPYTNGDNGIVEFKTGINFIFGRKDKNSDHKESLNGIGKSLFLDLLDFCLLCSFDKQKNVRLYEAKSHLVPYTIVLDFDIGGNVYTIKRSFKAPDEAYFGEGDNLIHFPELAELKSNLSNLIFTRSNLVQPTGLSFRTLISFFMKIHKVKDDRFFDPIKFSSHKSAAYLASYHLFFLGINNRLTKQNADFLEKSKNMDKAIAQIRAFTESKYQLDVAEVESEIDDLRIQLSKLEIGLNAFELAESYEQIEEEAIELTMAIKSLVAQNYADSEKISFYKASYRIKDETELAKNVSRIYSDLNEKLGLAIRCSISDAVAFRISLSESRREFLSEEILSLQREIEYRNIKIKDLEIERAQKFRFLEAKDAIEDLTEAFSSIQEKRKKISELEGRVKLYNDLKKEKADIKTQRSALDRKMMDLLESVKDKIAHFREIFIEVYNSVYPSSTSKSHFKLIVDSRKEAKMVLDVKIPAMRSEAKNQGRTLIYDLSVVVNGIKEQLHLPKFLIHDGIFDGMDKAHFIGACNLVNELVSRGIDLQYIVPLNEEGTLNENFGDVSEFTPKEIENQAILILTPTKKLLGINFD